MNRFEFPAQLFYTNEECFFPFLQQLSSEGSSHSLDEKQWRFEFNPDRVRVEDNLATIHELIHQDFLKFYQDQFTVSNTSIADESKHNETSSSTGKNSQDPKEVTAGVSEPETLLAKWRDGEINSGQIMQWLVDDSQVQLRHRHLALAIFLELLQQLEPTTSEPINHNNYRIYIGQLTIHYPIICRELSKSLSLVVTLTQAIERWHNESKLPGVLPMKWVRPTADDSAYELIEDQQSELLKPYFTNTGIRQSIVLDETYLTSSKCGALKSKERVMEPPDRDPLHDLRDIRHQLVCVLQQQLGLTDVLDKMAIVYEYQGNESKANASPYRTQQALMLNRIHELKKLILTIKDSGGTDSIEQTLASLKDLAQQAQTLRQLFILVNPRKGMFDYEQSRQLKNLVKQGMDAWLALPGIVRQEVLPCVSLEYLNNETSRRILTIAAENPERQAALVRLVDAECRKGGGTEQITNRIHERVHGTWWDLPHRKEIDRKLDEITGAVDKLADFESTFLAPHIAPPNDLSQSFIPTRVISAFGINNRYQRWQVVRVLADLVKMDVLTYQEFKTGLAFIQFQLQELYTPHFALSESSAHLLTTITAFLESGQALQEEAHEQKSVNCAKRLFNLFNQATALRDFSIMCDQSQWEHFCKTFVSPEAKVNFNNSTAIIEFEADTSQVLEAAG